MKKKKQKRLIRLYFFLHVWHTFRILHEVTALGKKPTKATLVNVDNPLIIGHAIMLVKLLQCIRALTVDLKVRAFSLPPFNTWSLNINISGEI